MSDYRRWLGDVSIDDLYKALKESDIGWSKPNDPSVGCFNAYWKGATSVVSKEGEGVTKRQVSYKKYNLLENEARILKECNSVHFPRVLSQSEDSITIEDCGCELTADKLPSDWKHQLVEILEDLKTCGVEHRDIKPDNLMVKDGVIKLIDFGWSRFFTDAPDNPPDCLGYPYKPSWGIDDSYSMRQVMIKLEHKLEELS